VTTSRPVPTALIGEAIWPPSSRMWARRRPAAGAVNRAGQSLNLVFGVATTSASMGGRASGPVANYTASGNTYTTVGLRSATSVPRPYCMITKLKLPGGSPLGERLILRMAA
jgi:hypothetical protein